MTFKLGKEHPNYSKPTWNKGLKKEMDSRVARQSGSGKTHSQWRGGITKHSRGWLYIHIDLIEPEYRCMAGKGKYVLMHRYIAAKKMNRPLEKNEIVHHIDGNKMNNHPDNLQVMTQYEHLLTHNHIERFVEGRKKALKRRTERLYERDMKIIKLVKQGYKHREVAQMFGLCRASIGYILKRHKD